MHGSCSPRMHTTRFHALRHSGLKRSSCAATQVAGGLFDWLTLFWLASLSVWVTALLAFHMVTNGMLEVAWLRLIPAQGGDIETGQGAPPVRIIDGVLERR